MGLFDFVEDLTEMAVETIVELPSIPVKIVKGTIKGVESGLDKTFED